MPDENPSRRTVLARGSALLGGAVLLSGVASASHEIEKGDDIQAETGWQGHYVFEYPDWTAPLAGSVSPGSLGTVIKEPVLTEDGPEYSSEEGYMYYVEWDTASPDGWVRDEDVHGNTDCPIGGYSC